ncbi:MAG: 50S ribosomal protein L3 N(5)-glutamine methyltransferase [Burkholderiaceae bacterium]
MASTVLLSSSAEARATSLLTLTDWIRAIASDMARAEVGLGQGAQSHLDDARWLVLGTLRLPPDAPEALDNARLLPAEQQLLFEVAGRRIQGRDPTAYILGEAWLRGHRFKSDPRAIIPRSLISELLWPPNLPLQGDPTMVLDLCTGGGSLAILAAMAWPDCRVQAVDLSPDALALARENVALHDKAQRIELHEGSLFEPLQKGTQFDLILCNPPYVPTRRVDHAPLEFQREPRMALEAGDDGMRVLRDLLASHQRWLTPGGSLVVEVGQEYEATMSLFEDEFPQLEPLWLETTQTNDHVFLLQGGCT